MAATFGGPPPTTTLHPPARRRPIIRSRRVAFRLAAALLALATTACSRGGSRGGDTNQVISDGRVDTSALRSGIPHPRPATRRPGEFPTDTGFGNESPTGQQLPIPPGEDSAEPPEPPTPPESGGLQRVSPPPGGTADDLRVTPWELLTPVGAALLRDVAAREERYFDEHGGYGRVGVGSREGWTVRLLFADASGWAAEATQTFYAGRSCVIWGGDAPDRAPGTRAEGKRGGAGTPVCD